MANEHLLATPEQTLRQTQASRSRMVSRLSDLEREAESLRTEIAEMDAVAAQTEETIYRILATVLGGRAKTARSVPPPGHADTSQPQPQPFLASPSPSSSKHDTVSRDAVSSPPLFQAGSYFSSAQGFAGAGNSQEYNLQPAAPMSPVSGLAPVRTATQAAQRATQMGEQFSERTIPQATASLLQEAGGPLHVNDIYRGLSQGGFIFSGHNPTISIATSLNRHSWFCRVAPGTFDLVERKSEEGREESAEPGSDSEQVQAAF